ncbi:hypothetical protein M885DRAFT_529503 [Pelagophyceae sp. CCMP2097]|nr:hypothetical protein M885DRAFT_529503 [Pelagophyceae sp. CCMP2097]
MPSAAPRVTWEGSLRTVGTPSRLRRGAERPTDEWRKGLRAHDDRPRELDTDTDAPRELIHRHLLMNVRTDWSHTLRRGGAARPRTIATPRVPRQPRRAAPSPPPPPPYQAPTKALRPSPRPARSPSRRRPHSSPPRRRKSVMVDAASSPHQDTRDASASPFSRDHTARGPRHGTADAASDVRLAYSSTAALGWRVASFRVRLRTSLCGARLVWWTQTASPARTSSAATATGIGRRTRATEASPRTRNWL